MKEDMSSEVEDLFSADRKLFVMGVASAYALEPEKKEKRINALKNFAQEKGIDFPTDDEIEDAKKSLGKEYDY